MVGIKLEQLLQKVVEAREVGAPSHARNVPLRRRPIALGANVPVAVAVAMPVPMPMPVAVAVPVPVPMAVWAVAVAVPARGVA